MPSSTTGFDPELIRRYDISGPRYTSYPTANLFRDDFPPGEYASALQRLPADARLSLYLHVPFCATVCYYCACNKIITNNRRHAVEYLERLHREMALARALIPSGHSVEQLHFGGGTPTYLTDPQFTALFTARTFQSARYATAGFLHRDRSAHRRPATHAFSH